MKVLVWEDRIGSHVPKATYSGHLSHMDGKTSVLILQHAGYSITKIMPEKINIQKAILVGKNTTIVGWHWPKGP